MCTRRGFTACSVVVGEPELLDRVDAHVHHEHVGVRDESPERARTCSTLDLEPDAALLWAREPERDTRVALDLPRRVRRHPPTAERAQRVGPPDRFHLHHVGAELGEVARTYRGGDAVADLQHPQVVERQHRRVRPAHAALPREPACGLERGARRHLRPRRQPARHRRRRSLRRVRGHAGEIEELLDLRVGGHGRPERLRKGGDPLLHRHDSVLARSLRSTLSTHGGPSSMARRVRGVRNEPN